MRPALWFRIAAVLLLLFAVGHTIGFLTFRPSAPEGRKVWDAMNSVHFLERSATLSYGGFYKGFGLSITLSQLFVAWLAWRLAAMAQRGIEDARSIAWGLVVLQLAGIGLALRYFSAPPAALSVLTSTCLLLGAISMRRPSAAP